MKLLKLLIGIVLSLSTAFICVGYAQINSEIGVEASMTGATQAGVFISRVGDATGVTVNTYWSTILNSEVTLDSAGDEKTLEITFYNNTAVNYYFKGVTYDTSIAGAYTNQNIKVECGMEASQKLEAKKECTASITFSFAEGYTPTGSETLRSILDFQWVFTGGEVNEIVAENFETVLNDESSYEKLTRAMDENYNGTQLWTASYAGNVPGAASSSSELFEALFGDLNIMLSDEFVTATCIIKRENIDGDSNTGDSYSVKDESGNVVGSYSGCEMTIYLTTADLSKDEEGNYKYVWPDKISVYAMIFTSYDSGKTWKQIGENMYEGTATVVGYKGGTSGGSFDTGSWASSKAYHGIAAGAGIGKLMSEALKTL